MLFFDFEDNLGKDLSGRERTVLYDDESRSICKFKGGVLSSAVMRWMKTRRPNRKRGITLGEVV